MFIKGNFWDVKIVSSVPAKYGETRRKEAICRLSAEKRKHSMERLVYFTCNYKEMASHTLN